MKLVFNDSPEAKRVAKRAVNLIPKSIYAAMHGINMFLCGGTFVSIISGEKVNDLDFFFGDAADLATFYDRVRHNREATKWYETDNAISFMYDGLKIQLVKKCFMGDLKSTISIFDFRAAMCGMGEEELRLVNGFWSEEDSLYDIAKKNLMVMPNHRNPHNVSYRIAKYVKRGWEIRGQSFIRLVLQQLIRSHNIHTLADVRDEIMGMDTVILADFFKKTDKYDKPGDIEISEATLKEFSQDVDDYFEKFAANQEGA